MILEMCDSSRGYLASRAFLLCTVWTSVWWRWIPWERWKGLLQVQDTCLYKIHVCTRYMFV